jgi:hypothetical protein
MGGEPCDRPCAHDDLMRVPDELRGCVCFIEAHWSGGSSEAGIGSAFFVGVALGLTEQVVEDRIAIYAVTAKHVLVSGKGALADRVVLRLNKKGGGVGEIPTEPTDWLLHPEADVAVLPVASNLELFEFRVYPVISAATAEWVDERTVGPGDDVFVTGLLVHHPGTTRIMPIVRVGNIAGLPEDPVRLRTGEDVVALLEVRSLGGLSGSPVFVHLPFWRDPPEGMVLVGTGAKAVSGGEHRLLGVMHGFYPVGKNDPDRVSGGDENLNTGIAVVVLVDRMLDLINSPDQTGWREELKKQR